MAMKKHESIPNPHIFMSITILLPNTLASCLYGAVKKNAITYVSELAFG
jgi:hypothetical protein